MKKLVYKICNPNLMPKTLSVYESDRASNQMLLSHLIGTLLKHGPTGEPEAYIAKNWSYNESTLTWTFKLHQNLRAENNELLNTTFYLKGFYFIFPQLMKKLDPPVFSLLEGYEEYKNGSQTISGIQAIDEYTLQFKFKRKCTGLLDFLAHTYYGFYCLDNFNTDRSWKSDQEVLSTNLYKLQSWNENQISIIKRDNWELECQSAPQVVNIDLYSLDELGKSIEQYPTIIEPSSSMKIISGYQEISNNTSLLKTFTITTNHKSALNNIQFRHFLRDKIRDAVNQMPNSIDDSMTAKYFYQTSEKVIGPIQKIKESSINHQDPIILKGLAFNKNSSFFQKLIELLDQSLQNTPITIQWNYLTLNDSSNLALYSNPEMYDLKASGVFTGPIPEDWVIEMMFCSDIGVKFPDENHHICELTQKFRDTNMTLEEYTKLFEQYIYDDARVIPISYGINRWFVSPEIDAKSVDQNSALIRFDLIKSI